MSTLVFLNGQIVPEAQATVSVFDRSFLYGDGLFETLHVFGGEPFRWAEHIERLQRGAIFLKIQIPFAPGELLEHARELARRNQLPDSLLRITLSRGVGLRGYSPKGADRPTVVMSVHPPPEANAQTPAWSVVTASCRLPAGEALAEFKTCNKLPQVLARAEADAAGADEALLLNTNGEVVEAATSNLFWVDGGDVCTPPLSSGILAGVTRLVVGEICRDLGTPVRETSITSVKLKEVEGIFLSLSSWGIVEIERLDGQKVKRSPKTAQVRAAYQAMIRKHSGRQS